MWQVLSFTGRFDKKCLVGLPEPQASERRPSSRERWSTLRAVQARGRVRLAHRYARLRDEIRAGARAAGASLTPAQLELLALLDDGTLVRQANHLTICAGHGRLRRADGSAVDIGGSTGGYARSVLDDWQPPDLTEFQRGEASDAS